MKTEIRIISNDLDNGVITETEARNKLLFLCGVVKSFYCNGDDGEYNNNPCAEQCKFCKSAESLQ